MDWSKATNQNRQVSFQGRLDKVLERQKIKLHDNSIKIVGVPEDILIVKKKTTVNGDPISKVVSDHKIVNCVFPVLKKIPIRKVTREFESGYKLTQLVTAYGEGSDKGIGQEQQDLTSIEIQVPFGSQIDIGDTLIRVFVQETVQTNTVMVFEVVDIFGDFSNNAPLTSTVKIAITTEPVDLSKPIYQAIANLAQRRLAAGY